MLPFLFDGQHLHGNVSGRGVELEIVEHRPTQHVRKEHVEGDGRRTELARQGERRLAAARDNRLEPLVTRESHQDPGIVRVVFDDQQCRVALAHVRAVVDDGFFGW